jgi:hypothetical protein
MTDYLALERSVSGLADGEKSEKSEKTSVPAHLARKVDDGAEEPVVTLIWHDVDRGSVTASAPPSRWDGTLPASCGWPDLCHVLGPCPGAQMRDCCPFAGPVRGAGVTIQGAEGS